MNWLIHNPIGDMNGPAFLVLYSGLIAIAAVASYRSLHALDTTDLEPPPVVPSDPDPYELSYLRGGVNETIRTVVFSLLQRGYVEVVPGKKKRWVVTAPTIRSIDDRPDDSDLIPLELVVRQFLHESKKATELFIPSGLPVMLKGHSAVLKERSESEGLLSPAEVKSAAWSTWLMAVGFLLLVGSYKMLVAFSKGKTNIGGLIGLFSLSLLVISFTVGIPAGRRLSKRGRAYLSRIKLAYSGMRSSAAREPGAAVGSDSSSLLLVGLFGLTTLKETSYSSYASMFPASTDGGGCGTAGGGCGGGGCGGCGG